MPQTITIDGETVERDDGSEVCVGYYTDTDGRVIDRFAVMPGEFTVSDAVAGVEFVASMNELPPVDDHYREQF